MRFLLMAFTHASRAEGVVVSGFECYGFWRHRHHFLILGVNNHLLAPAMPDLVFVIPKKKDFRPHLHICWAILGHFLALGIMMMKSVIFDEYQGCIE